MPSSKRKSTTEINPRAPKKPRLNEVEQLPPLPTPDWLDELTDALLLKAPFKGREQLSLQVFDLCQYGSLHGQEVWRRTGHMFRDTYKCHIGVVDERGEHYWICYYTAEHSEVAMHDIHMNRLLQQHQVPHVITTLCHVMLEWNKLICLVYPHHPLAMSLFDYCRREQHPFSITESDIDQGVQDVLSTLQSVHWKSKKERSKRRYKRRSRDRLEFRIGRRLYDCNVMLVPDVLTNRVLFKLVDFHEGCARVGDRVYEAPQLSDKPVPYDQCCSSFLTGASCVAETIGATNLMHKLDRACERKIKVYQIGVY